MKNQGRSGQWKQTTFFSTPYHTYHLSSRGAKVTELLEQCEGHLHVEFNIIPDNVPQGEICPCLLMTSAGRHLEILVRPAVRDINMVEHLIWWCNHSQNRNGSSNHSKKHIRGVTTLKLKTGGVTTLQIEMCYLCIKLKSTDHL